ncbi:MAG: carboxyl transferase domain-containing protein, partial [Candidatus Borkfalkia sp.]
MDKIKLLQTRRSKVLETGSEIRKTISELVDADSFVELSGYSFSKNEFYGEDAEGEGVVTGFATVEGYPVYVAAQNFKVMSGGVSKANCEKILKCLTLAEKNSTPVVYILNSLGVQVGEGVTVLEGLASVLAKSARLHGVVPQFTIVKGEVYGQAALFTANADFNFFLKEGVLAANSPLVISAKSGKNLPKEEVGGAKALDKTNLVSFTAENMAEIRSKIFK